MLQLKHWELLLKIKWDMCTPKPKLWPRTIRIMQRQHNTTALPVQQNVCSVCVQHSAIQVFHYSFQKWSGGEDNWLEWLSWTIHQGEPRDLNLLEINIKLPLLMWKSWMPVESEDIKALQSFSLFLWKYFNKTNDAHERAGLWASS